MSSKTTWSGSASTFSRSSASDSSASTEFRIGSEAKTDDQHLIYNDKSGALYYDADGSDVAAKVQIAELDKHLDLQARNFFVSSDYEIK